MGETSQTPEADASADGSGAQSSTGTVAEPEAGDPSQLRPAPAGAPPSPAAEPPPGAPPPPPKSFFSSLPGLLTALTGLIAAVTALVTAVAQAPWAKPTETPTVVATATASPSPASSETPRPTPTWTATAVSTPTPRPTHTATPEATQTATSVASPSATPTEAVAAVVLVDDFTDPSSGWYVETSDESESSYIDGEYRIVQRLPAQWVGEGLKHEPIYADLDISVDVRQLHADGYAGLAIRQSGEELYCLVISVDGFYRIELATADEVIYLVDWTESPLIRTAGAVNRVQVEAIGPTIRFLVNGQQLAEVADDTVTAGQVYFVVGAFEEVPAEARFDNLRLEPLQRMRPGT